MPLTSSFSMHLIYASKLFHVKQLQIDLQKNCKKDAAYLPKVHIRMDTCLRMSKPGQTEFDQGGQAKARSRAVVDRAMHAASVMRCIYNNC